MDLRAAVAELAYMLGMTVGEVVVAAAHFAAFEVAMAAMPTEVAAIPAVCKPERHQTWAAPTGAVAPIRHYATHAQTFGLVRSGQPADCPVSAAVEP